jgi:drug/metabolite transporter (DMT)-like permease
MNESRLLPYVGLAATVVIWSITPSVVRAVSLETGAADAIVIRMLLNGLAALPLLLLLGPKIDWADLKTFLLVGIVGNFGYYIGSNYGFANMSAGAGGMVYATNPLMIAVLSALVGTEQLSLGIVAGLLISFAGTVYLFADGLDGAGEHPVFGGVMMLLGCLAWSIYVIFSRPLIVKYGAPKVTMWVTALCALPSLIFSSPTTLPAIMHLSAMTIIYLLGLCFIGTILSVMLWNYAAGKLPPSSVGATLYLIPPCIALFGWLWFGEATGIHTLIAGLIILVGVAVAEFGKSLKVATA